jgi:hypothetical protein
MDASGSRKHHWRKPRGLPRRSAFEGTSRSAHATRWEYRHDRDRPTNSFRKGSFVKAIFIALLAATIAAPCLAQEPKQEAKPEPRQEPVGCDKFKWPLDKERATLTGTDLPKLASGASVTFPIPWASIVALVPFADAKLPTAPELTPSNRQPSAARLAARACARA